MDKTTEAAKPKPHLCSICGDPLLGNNWTRDGEHNEPAHVGCVRDRARSDFYNDDWGGEP